MADFDRIKHILENRRINILICTPCYGNMVHLGFHSSIFKMVKHFTQLNLDFDIFEIGQESLITRARNSMMSKFIANNEYSHILFIDADISFDSFDILKLISHDKEITAGIYPKKSINWEKVKKNVDSNDILPRALDYNFNLYKDENGDKVVNGDIIRMNDVATGFMLIARSAVFNIIFNNQDKRYFNNVAGYDLGNNKDCFYNLFHCGIVNNIYLSEDYYFCHLARECGIEIWADTTIKLTHSGTMDYRGQCVLNNEDDKDKKLFEL